jgi:hypothetical protein
MVYLEIFDRVAKYVTDRGAFVTWRRSPHLSDSDFAEAKASCRISLPDDLLEMYAEVGDGTLFRWTLAERPDLSLIPPAYLFDYLNQLPKNDGPVGGVELTTLSQLVTYVNESINWRIEWDDDYDYRFTKDPNLAKSTAKRMRKWARFHDEGNGDQFCLDGGIAPSPVVFDKHDWMDGGTGDNGHRLGDSLLAFYQDWSKVCFQGPSSLWWPAVFRPKGGVDWQSDEFDEGFRLPADE